MCDDGRGGAVYFKVGRGQPRCVCPFPPPPTNVPPKRIYKGNFQEIAAVAFMGEAKSSDWIGLPEFPGACDQVVVMGCCPIANYLYCDPDPCCPPPKVTLSWELARSLNDNESVIVTSTLTRLPVNIQLPHGNTSSP